MIRKTLLLTCLCFVGLAASGSAKADTIGPACGSPTTGCFGSSYTLTYNPTGDPDAFDVFLTIDTTGFTKASTDTLDAVSVQVVKTTPDFNGTPALLAGPSTFSTTIDGGLNGNGCTGNGGGFLCSESSTNGVAVGAGDIYTFEWLVTVNASSDWLTGDAAAQVKALYVKTNGNSDGVTNAPITLTDNSPAAAPEPSSLMLLGTGIIGAAGIVKKRLSA